MVDGGWRMEDEEDGGWRMADGGWRMAEEENGGWPKPASRRSKVVIRLSLSLQHRVSSDKGAWHTPRLISDVVISDAQVPTGVATTCDEMSPLLLDGNVTYDSADSPTVQAGLSGASVIP